MVLIDQIRFYLECHGKYRGDSIAYLRSQGVRMGEDCDLLTNVTNFGSEPWLIEIGDRVTLTSGVVLITHDGSSRLFRKHSEDMNPRYGNRFGAIRILDDCFVGVNAIILPGVEIGPDSIVGAGSIVNKSVPPQMVFAGNPARPICTLDEYIERYRAKMLLLKSEDRTSLRRELTTQLWGEYR